MFNYRIDLINESKVLISSLLNCASSRLRSLPIIDMHLTRLHALRIINTRFTHLCARTFTLINWYLTRLCLDLCCVVTVES